MNRTDMKALVDRLDRIEEKLDAITNLFLKVKYDFKSDAQTQGKKRDSRKRNGPLKQIRVSAGALPETGYVRIWQIVGDKRKGVEPYIPITRSSWYAGIKDGRYPKPVKLGERVAMWDVEDVRAVVERG